ncbi:MAG: outer membrane beta-barrel protein, partial [Saprospiraceae bacterium]
FMQVNANLPRDWKLEVTGWYQGSTLEGIIRSEALYGVDLGLQKSFLDDRLELRLSGDGVIQKFFRGRIDYQEQDIAILSRWEAPTVNGKLTYRFGNRFLKKGDSRRGAAAEERSRMNLD